MPLVDFVPGLGSGDMIADAHVGPDKNVWVLWYNVGVVDSFRITIFDPSLTAIATHNFDGVFPITSLTQGRFSIVVNKNNTGVIAYQRDGFGTYIRRVETDGTLGAAVLLSANFYSYPNLTLWNGCVDAILVMPGGTTYQRFDFTPFLVATSTADAPFYSQDLATYGVTWFYVYNMRCSVYDSWTNEIHIFTACSTYPYPSTYAQNPMSILHVWGTQGQNGSVFTPVPQYAFTTGSYPPLQSKIAWNKREAPADKVFYLAWRQNISDPELGGIYASLDNRKGGLIATWSDADGWGSPSVIYGQLKWDFGGYADLDVHIDGLGVVHTISSNNDYPTYRESNRVGYEEAYPGTGIQLHDPEADPPTSVVCKAVPCCSYIGDTVDTSEMMYARGYPTDTKSFIFFRTSYSVLAGSQELKWAYKIHPVNSSYLPAEDLATCGAEEFPPFPDQGGSSVTAIVYVFDPRSRPAGGS